MAIHFLKTINPYFQDLWDRKKTFEIRLDDRGYQVNDVLVLEEYDLSTNTKTGREIQVRVPYVLRGKPYLPDGYVCMSIQETCRIDI